MHIKSLFTQKSRVRMFLKNKSFKAVGIILLLFMVLAAFFLFRDAEPAITVNDLEPYDVVPRPLTISGSADALWFTNGSFRVVLLDDDKNILGEVDAVALNDWKSGGMIPFEAVFSYTPSQTLNGTLMFYRGDSTINPTERADAVEHTFPIRFGERMISLYYLDATDPCAESKLSKVTRFVSDENPIYETIELLIEGEVREDEWDRGVRTQFPHYKFKLLSAELDGGTLLLEFSHAPSFMSGTDCRVLSIKKQIEETALQFFSVREVEIIIKDN